MKKLMQKVLFIGHMVALIIYIGDQASNYLFVSVWNLDLWGVMYSHFVHFIATCHRPIDLYNMGERL
jgi:hypothetical protein